MLATTGIRPMEKITIRAAVSVNNGVMAHCILMLNVLLCRLLNFSNGSNGSGYSRRTTSVKTLMAPCACINVAPSMHMIGICSTSQAAVTGRQEKIWTCSAS